MILSLLILVGFSISAHCGSPWEAFLKNPDKDAFSKLERSIAASAQSCRWGDPANSNVAPTVKQDKQLFELIVTGNESAFRAALLVSRCLDGGELEDFYRSVGSFFEAQPRVFLRTVKEDAIPDSQLSDFLTMLPLDTVDDFDRQMRIIENRIALLKSIDEVSLEEEKKRGLFFLEKEKKEVKK